MKIDVLTLFPQMFDALSYSITGRALEKGLLNLTVTDIRQFSKNKHKKCDDYPYGGGSGMVMSVQPLYDAAMAVDAEHKAHRIYLSPKGKRLDQQTVIRLSKAPRLMLICGRYEGVDQRAIDLLADEEISIGDYVLTGGELPSMVLIDCVSRHIPGVLSSIDSLNEESFSDNLLEYPQYTRPEEFMGLKVPEVLLSGNHKEIEKWRRQKSLEITLNSRPDIIEKAKGKQ
jgi:tRNA (guanine37-N1)-methyltransferase